MQKTIRSKSIIVVFAIHLHCQTVARFALQIRLGTLPTHIKRIFLLVQKHCH